MTFFSNKGWLGTGFAIVMFLILSVMITSMGTKVILSSNRSIDAARQKQAYWTSLSGGAFLYQEKEAQGIMNFGGGTILFFDLCVIGQSGDVIAGGGISGNASLPGKIITILSENFANNATLGDAYISCSPSDESESPQLNWSGVPTDAQTMVITMEDADGASAGETFWALYNIPAATTSLAADYEVTGEEEELVEYRGPCPEEDGINHRYVFKVYALNASIDSSPANMFELRNSLEGKILACGLIIGKYENTS